MRGPAAAACSVAATLALVMLAGGCASELDTKRAAQTESIFGLFAPPKPAEAAAWSQDPYDADKRYRGTNLLANAPFGGEDVYVRMYASKLGAPPATEPDPDPGVRGIAARALGMHGDPASADLILPLLKEKDKNVRLEAARALQRIHNPKTVEPLMPLLLPKAEPEADVRSEVAIGLGQYAERRVVQTLVGALDDDSLLVTTNVRRSLETLTGKDFGEDQRAWLKWLGETQDIFVERKAFMYPVFQRDKYWYEYLPFVPPPPNEISGTPIGLGADGKADLAARRIPSSGGGAAGAGAPPVAAASAGAAGPAPTASTAGGPPVAAQSSTTTTAATPAKAATPAVDLIPNEQAGAKPTAVVPPAAQQPAQQPAAATAVAAKPAPETEKPAVKAETKVEAKPESKPEPKPEPKPTLDPKPEPKPEVKPAEQSPFRKGTPVKPRGG